MTTDENTDRLDEARARLGRLAVNLASTLDPHAVAVSFSAVGATMMAAQHGRPAAAEVLRQLASEVERDGPTYDA